VGNSFTTGKIVKFLDRDRSGAAWLEIQVLPSSFAVRYDGKQYRVCIPGTHEFTWK